MGQDTSLAHTIVPVPATEFLDRLPAYDTYSANWDRLDGLRQIINSFNYAPYGLAFPFGPTTGLAFSAMSTKEGSLQAPAGAYLLGISTISYADLEDKETQGIPFRFSVTDKGSGLGLTERSFVFYRNMSGLVYGGEIAPYDAAQILPFGDRFTMAQVYWLDAPLVITSPGQVQIAITNLANATTYIQLCLHFAYPINNVSVNTPTIKPTR